MPGHGVDRGSGASTGNPDTPVTVSTIDAKGDLLVGTADNAITRLAIGSNGYRLVADSTQPEGMRWVAETTNAIIDAAGDIIYGTAADTAAVLPIGTARQHLAVNAGATAPTWVSDTQNDVIAAKGDLLVGTAADTITNLTVGTDGQALVADSSQTEGVAWSDVPTNTSPHRQTLLSSELDSSGYCALLSAGAALNYNINAASGDAVFSFADGFNSAGAKDWVSVLSADASNQGSLNASNTHYIHATYSSATAVTWGQCLIPPQYGYAFDRTQAALLNFEAADATTTMVDDFGNTWTAAGNAQIDTAQSKFGTASLLLDGTGDYIESTNFTTLGDGSWEISLWVRWNSLPTAGTNQYLFSATNGSSLGAAIFLNNNAGTIKMAMQLSSTGASSDIYNAVGGTNASWSTGTWYKFRLVFDALAGTYKLYLSVAGAAETVDISTSSSSRICAVTKIRLGDNGAGASQFNGWIDAFRFIRAATVTTTETPGASAPAIGDYPVHFFSIPAMKMYYASAASASAGVDPTLTAVKRVFAGEQDTNGSAVTATRNYALRGEYVSDKFAAAAGTAYTKAHNIGVAPRDVIVDAINATTQNGWTPGYRIGMWGNEQDTSGNNNGITVGSVRSSLTFSVQATSMGVLAAKTGGSLAGITMASWLVQIVARRGW
ncbi:MAG TPA: hypothetical protein VFW03_13695 [Gemmatimonadaceae bacterium]|nr:hypothetical protein [Gemmatimonadaceae bacterium]